MNEQKEITPHDEWVYQKGNMLKLQQMLKHPGWTEVLEPILISHKEQAERDLVVANIKDYNQFLTVRQTARAINLIFGYIKTIIANGEAASEKLEKEKDDES